MVESDPLVLWGETKWDEYDTVLIIADCVSMIIPGISVNECVLISTLNMYTV